MIISDSIHANTLAFASATLAALEAEVAVLADVAGEAVPTGALPWELVRCVKADFAFLEDVFGDTAPTGALSWELVRRVLAIPFFP